MHGEPAKVIDGSRVQRAADASSPQLRRQASHVTDAGLHWIRPGDHDSHGGALALGNDRTAPWVPVSTEPVFPLREQLLLSWRWSVLQENVAVSGDGGTSVELRKHRRLMAIGEPDENIHFKILSHRHPPGVWCDPHQLLSPRIMGHASVRKR